MAEGPDGVIWIATSEGLILRLSGDTLVPELGITEKKPISVRSLHTTPDGALWIGYAGFGMGRLKGGHYARITMEQGLSDDYVSQILADNQGGLWITGNSGLSQVLLSELADVAEGRAPRLRSRVFGRSEGLSSLQANYDNFPTVCRAQNGRLWMAMRSGLLTIQPEKIRDNHEPPPVVIEVVAVNDQTVAVSENRLPLQRQGAEHATILRPSPAVLRVTPDHRKLEFEFAALSYASPENVHFRYRLSNFDKGWVEAGTRRSATYPQLPAGDYGFRVIACNNAGVWNETGASFAFVVTPFFWQTWWFRIMALLLFTTGIIASVRYVSFRRLRKRMLQLKEEAALHQERARIARDMHDEVGAKLTRLFLLTEMAGGQPELSAVGRSDMREISDTARETILAFDEVLWAVNPRNDTLGDLINYLCRHTEEFLEGSPTQWAFDLPLVIPPVMLPTEVRHQVFLASKEALNNVLKHAKAHQVCLRLILHPAAFELVIHDDGTGFDPGLPSRRHSGGNGLGNMQERIRGLGGRFECDIQPGQGTRISFLVPVASSPSNE
jgi:signal transduction histidine kinase